MEAKRERTQSTPEKAAAAAASAAVISLVLGDGDLLGEIFLRFALPGSLVRAALVCKRWLRAASDPAFLRRFRDLHPPRLLGCFLNIRSIRWYCHVEFIPMLPPPPELAARLPSTSFSLGTDGSPPVHILSCRNGRVVMRVYHGDRSAEAMYRPLNPAKRMVIFPPPPVIPLEDNGLLISSDILGKEDGDERSYFWFTLDYSEKGAKVTACVYMLQDDAWRMHTSATTQVPGLNGTFLQPPKIFLADDKIYMGLTIHKILVLDLASSTILAVEFPDRAAVQRNSVLSPANGSDICLVHVNKLQLCIWLHREGGWSLVDTICLRNMCSTLRKQNSTTEDQLNDSVVYIQEVGDNAEFVFLHIYGCVVHLDVRSRAWKKLYEVADEDTCVCQIHPFMTIWPPYFPALEE